MLSLWGTTSHYHAPNLALCYRTEIIQIAMIIWYDCCTIQYAVVSLSSFVSLLNPIVQCVQYNIL